MQSNEYITWIGALGLATIIHAALLVNISQDWNALNQNSTLDKIITIDFSYITQQQKASTAEEKPATEKPEQKPVVTKKIMPVTDTAPVKPVAAESNQLTTYAPPVPETSTEKHTAQDKPTIEATKTAHSKQETDLYLQQLLAHIEKHKYYPTSARRRGLTGAVAIEITIGDDGNIVRLDTHSEHNILSHAAKQTIQAAVPLPIIENTYKNDLNLKFNMAYVLD